MIPENKQLEVTKALQQAFNTNTFEHIEQLTKGLSGAWVFRITVHGKPFLLRIINHTRDQPEYYFDCLRLAAEAGLAPRIHYLNIEDRILITDFIEDNDFPLTDAKIKMADLLRDLHSLPRFSYRLNFIDASDTFLQKFLALDIVPRNDIKDLLESYERLAKVYPRNDDNNLVSCHNDVKRDNIIFDGVRPWLVDWEAARLNDRYVDLAAIANFVVKTENDETEFLERYFGESLNQYNLARFFLMTQVVHMFCFTLCSIRGSAGEPIDVHINTPSFNEFHQRLWDCEISLADNNNILLYAFVHMKRFRDNVQTTRFEESLRIVANYPSTPLLLSTCPG